MSYLRPSTTVSLLGIWCLIAIVPVIASADDEAHHHDVTEGSSGQDHTAHSQGREVLGQEHGHASHARGDEVGGASRLSRWLGKFHPVVVHFPIALLITAALAELLKCLLGVEWLGSAARYSVLAGVAGAMVAAPLGWLDAAFANYSGSLAWTLEVHRWLGTTVAVWSIIIAIFSELSFRLCDRRLRVWYLITLFVGALLVGVTGHFGGTLIFGRGYYSW